MEKNLANFVNTVHNQILVAQGPGRKVQGEKLNKKTHDTLCLIPYTLYLNY